MRVIEIDAAVVDEFTAAGYWTDEILIDAVERAVDAHPDRLAVVDESSKLTYGQLWEQSMSIAGWLHRHGVRAGTAVTVQLPNWCEFVAIAVAVEALGAVLNPMLPLYREHEMRHVIRTCQSRVLIVPERHRSRDDFLAMAGRLRDELDSLSAIMVVRPSSEVPNGFVAFDEAVSGEPIDGVVRMDPNAPVLVAFTSGTESDAKGCVHTNNTTIYELREASRGLQLSSDDVVFMPSPIAGGTGVEWGLRLGLWLGTTQVLQDRWDPALAATLIARYRCTYALAATPFVRDLVEHVEQHPGAFDLSAFRMFVSGGAPIPRELVAATREVLGAELLACYGQTECFMTVLVRIDDPDDIKLTCDGTPLPGVEVRVVDDEACDVLPGTPGECWTRGPHVMLGYLNPPESSAGFRPGDWLHSGDEVTVDDRGRLQVVGRKKETIIRGGMNIAPREIEDALIRHPSVSRVAIVGYPDERLGERACAFVVPERTPPTLDELTHFLRERGFANYKLPERLEILDELPVTPIGKVQKTQLKDWLSGGN